MGCLGIFRILGILGFFGIYRDFRDFLGILMPLRQKSVRFTFREQLWSYQQKYTSVKDR